MDIVSTFRIRREALDRARELAAKYGVSFVVKDLDVEVVARELAQDVVTNGDRAWAKRLCDEYVQVTLSAPHSGTVVVAMAEQKKGSGLPTFQEFDPAEPYWTPARMDAIDFSRCDVCGVHHARTKVFIVREADGEFRQIGGACVKHLELPRKLQDMLDGFRSFVSDIDDSLEGGDFGFWKRGGRFNMSLALVLADELIGAEGYVSRSRAEAELRLSTADMVLETLYSTDPTHFGSWYDCGLKRWRAGDGEKIRAEILRWLDNGVDDAFHRSVRTAIQAETESLFGHVAYAVAQYRKAQEDVPAFCYKHENLTPEQIAEACGLTVADLAKMIGVKRVGTKAATKKFSKVLPGVWTVTSRASWEGMYGWQDLLVLTRDDGARVRWVASNLPAREGGYRVGDRFLILSATVGQPLPEHHRYGVQGTKISRVKLEAL